MITNRSEMWKKPEKGLSKMKNKLPKNPSGYFLVGRHKVFANENTFICNYFESSDTKITPIYAFNIRIGYIPSSYIFFEAHYFSNYANFILWSDFT